MFADVARAEELVARLADMEVLRKNKQLPRDHAALQRDLEEAASLVSARRAAVSARLSALAALQRRVLRADTWLLRARPQPPTQEEIKEQEQEMKDIFEHYNKMEAECSTQGQPMSSELVDQVDQLKTDWARFLSEGRKSSDPEARVTSLRKSSDERRSSEGESRKSSVDSAASVRTITSTLAGSRARCRRLLRRRAFGHGCTGLFTSGSRFDSARPSLPSHGEYSRMLMKAVCNLHPLRPTRWGTNNSDSLSTGGCRCEPGHHHRRDHSTNVQLPSVPPEAFLLRRFCENFSAYGVNSKPAPPPPPPPPRRFDKSPVPLHVFPFSHK
ncbi:hypothetical protein JYU34_005482 [Plutella xylostella]|uniref:Uncharacterized protein n=1 Tax=Plutella xylostella TaxID=51655 RepID=A0ABQ7QWX7_PLUXY|nr:hypothetical protein JYU34_005482 [Plutella xylostella]